MECKERREDMVVLDIDEEKTFEVARHALLGKIILAKLVNRRVARDMIIKSWGHPKGLNVIELTNNVFLFNFRDAKKTKKAFGGIAKECDGKLAGSSSMGTRSNCP